MPGHLRVQSLESVGTSAVSQKRCEQGSMEWAVSFDSSGAGLDQTAGVELTSAETVFYGRRLVGRVARTTEFP